MKRNLIFLLFFAALCLGCKEQESVVKPINGVEDTDGRLLMVMTGSVQELAARECCPNAILMQCSSETDIFSAVNSGKVDAGLVSSLSNKVAAGKFANVYTVMDTLRRMPIGAIFGKDKSELRLKFNEFVSEYVSSGEFANAFTEWSDFSSGRTMPQTDPDKCPNGVIKFACCPTNPPISMMIGEEVSGLEPEMCVRFAQSIGCKPEFCIMEWPSLIASVSLGKNDMAIATVCITEERQKQVDFSVPYLFEGSALLINKKFIDPEIAAQLEESIVNKSLSATMKDSFTNNFITENRYKLLLSGLWSTIIIVILSALFGTLLGFILCYMNMRKNKFVHGAATLYIDFMRCMPQMVFLMIMFYIVFGKSEINNVIVAVISFSLCFGAYTSVIFQNTIEGIDKGQMEAALSMGFSRLRAFFDIILPQAVQRALPVYKGEFIGLIKATSIVGYIAVFDLTKASDLIRSRTFEPFFPLIMVTVIYFLIIWVLSLGLKYIDVKTQPKRRKF